MKIINTHTMKKNTFTLLLGLALTASSMLVAQVKTIDLAESSIQWTGTKLTSGHTGTLNFNSGELSFTDGKLSAGTFIVNMASINCTDLEGEYAQKLIGHLKSDDFFSVEKHPEATLVFNNIHDNGDGVYHITGDFTIKGITSPAMFELVVKDNTAVTKVVLDRSKYNVRYGSDSFFDNLGDKVISDNFDLVVTLKM